MTIVMMNKYGRLLTDRTYGKGVALKIIEENDFPVALDFKGVISLGSSCGDEILSVIREKQNHLKVSNVNGAVESCLEKVAVDIGIELSIV